MAQSQTERSLFYDLNDDQLTESAESFAVGLRAMLEALDELSAALQVGPPRYHGHHKCHPHLISARSSAHPAVTPQALSSAVNSRDRRFGLDRCEPDFLVQTESVAQSVSPEPNYTPVKHKRSFGGGAFQQGGSLGDFLQRYGLPKEAYVDNNVLSFFMLANSYSYIESLTHQAQPVTSPQLARHPLPSKPSPHVTRTCPQVPATELHGTCSAPRGCPQVYHVLESEACGTESVGFARPTVRTQRITTGSDSCTPISGMESPFEELNAAVQAYGVSRPDHRMCLQPDHAKPHQWFGKVFRSPSSSFFSLDLEAFAEESNAVFGLDCDAESCLQKIRDLDSDYEWLSLYEDCDGVLDRQFKAQAQLETEAQLETQASTDTFKGIAEQLDVAGDWQGRSTPRSVEAKVRNHSVQAAARRMWDRSQSSGPKRPGVLRRRWHIKPEPKREVAAEQAPQQQTRVAPDIGIAVAAVKLCRSVLGMMSRVSDKKPPTGLENSYVWEWVAALDGPPHPFGAGLDTEIASPRPTDAYRQNPSSATMYAEEPRYPCGLGQLGRMVGDCKDVCRKPSKQGKPLALGHMFGGTRQPF